MSETTTQANESPPASETPVQPAARLKVEQILVWLLFLISGACGLIYEVLWCRQLGLLFGNTAHSLSAVLGAFMSGLALGSYMAGRLCHRFKRPLLVYGLLELLIGVYCAILPWFFGDNSPLLPLYRSLYGETGSSSLGVARFAISFGLLLIPTTFMGATLPILSQFLVKSRAGLGRIVGALYAVNSFGAVLGAVAAGFVLLPELGKAGTNTLAVVCNILLGVLAIAFGLKAEVAPSAESFDADATPQAGGTESTITPDAVKFAVLAFGITGFAAMATQIGWTRAISLGTGSSTYAFSLIVAVFILGLSTGGSWGARIAPRVKDPVAQLGIILLLIGLLALLVSMCLGWSPLLFYLLIALGSDQSWTTLLCFQALGIASLIFVPTFLMGATMPLTVQIASRSSRNPGRTVGSVYAVNTLGSILGSFLGGLFLLPRLQIQSTLEVMALLYVIPGIVLFAKSSASKDKRQVLSAASIVLPLVAVGILSPRWDQRLMSSGIYLLRDPKLFKAAREFRLLDAIPNFGSGSIVRYYNEGVESTVAVTQIGDELSLRVGGKPDASARGDLITQVSLTLLPEVLHASGPQEVLVIGLGSGVSTGAALAPDTVQRVDVVEMSPQVVEASWWFQHVNGLTYTQPPQGQDPSLFHSWIVTPKVEVLVNDGRNHLQLTSRKYDIIASEPSNPWMAGVGNLFTREAFELCHKCLKPGGVMCQWLHSYRLESDRFFSVLRTYASVFKHVQVWQSRDTDYMLIGSDEPLNMPLQRLRERLQQPGISKWLQRVHMDRASEFLAAFVADEETVRTLSQNAELHTDDNMLLEFSAPKSVFRDVKIFKSANRVSFPEKIVDLSGIKDGAAFMRELDLAVSGREHWRHGLEGPGLLDAHQKAANAIDPYQLWASMRPAETGNPATVQPPAQVSAPLAEAKVLLREKKPDEALAIIDKITDPGLRGQCELLRARALLAKKSFDEATLAALNAMKTGGPAGECIDVALIAARLSNHQAQTLDVLQKILSAPNATLDPAAAPIWALQANLLYSLGQFDRALESVRQAQFLDELNTSYGLGEAAILNALKRPYDAIRALRLRAARDPVNPALKADLCHALLAAAEKAEDVLLAGDLRMHARRVARETTALKPNAAAAWELLCRCLLAIEKTDASRAGIWREQGRESFSELMRVNKWNLTSLPKDLREYYRDMLPVP